MPTLTALALALLLGQAGAAACADIGQISKLSDVTFSNLDPMVPATSAQSVCVFSSALTALYTITAAGSGSGQAFTLQGGGSIPDLPYSVAWSPTAGATSGTALSPNTPLANQQTGALSLVCLVGIGLSASVIISLAPADLQSALSGITYSGQLSLTVTAQ